MKKILLICDMGMSTSLVVKRMQEAAVAQGIEAQIEAKGSQEFDDCAAEFDCYLLAPQISYKLADFQATAQTHDRPISLINMMDYGMTDGKKILGQALSMMEA